MNAFWFVKFKDFTVVKRLFHEIFHYLLLLPVVEVDINIGTDRGDLPESEEKN